MSDIAPLLAQYLSIAGSDVDAHQTRQGRIEKGAAEARIVAGALFDRVVNIGRAFENRDHVTAVRRGADLRAVAAGQEGRLRFVDRSFLQRVQVQFLQRISVPVVENIPSPATGKLLKNTSPWLSVNWTMSPVASS